jgi:hypothetical protein
LKNKKYYFCQVYAPQQGRTLEEKIEFYDALDEHLNHIGSMDEETSLIIMGNLNARVGNNRNGFADIIRPFGEAVKNSEGEDLIDFCVRNRLKIMNGYFKHILNRPI